MKDPHWTLATANVNGLRASVKRGFGPWLADNGADVLCMQELRMQADQMLEAHQPPAGWSAVQVDAEKKGYSGVSIWSRLPARSTATGLGLDWADREGRVARMETDEATIFSIYLPSGSSSPERQALKEAFMDHFFEWTAGLLREGRPMVLCGDLNIAHTEDDIHNAKSNKDTSGFLPHERAWFGRLLDQGWVDVWRSLHPTDRTWSWWSNRGQARALDRGWRIDYQLATPDLAARATDAWMQGREPHISDHCPVFVRYRRA